MKYIWATPKMRLLVAWQTRVLGRFIAAAARVSSGNLQQFLWAEVLFIPDLAWHEVCPFSSGWLICKVGIFDCEERLLSQLKWCVSKAFQKLEPWFARVRSCLEKKSGTHFQKPSRRPVCPGEFLQFVIAMAGDSQGPETQEPAGE